MFVVFPSRGIGAAALAAGLLLAGCSSDSDVPPTVTSAPDGGTQMNTDTGSGGEFPDVNTTPTQRPTSTIQDLAQAPTGLAGAPRGTQYGEALVGGPTSTAEPPAPPPPPEPPQEALAPIPEPGITTDSSEGAARVPQAEPTPEPAAEPAPEPTYDEAPAAPEEAEAQPTEQPSAPEAEGQTIYGSTPEAPEPVEPAPEPTVAEAAPPAAAPEQYGEPAQPEVQPAPAPVTTQTPSVGAAQQAQLPAGAYSPPSGALGPEAYGVAYPQPNQTPSAPAGAAPAMAVPAAPTPGEPVGLIYFRDGSSELSSDDRSVLEQIAGLQRTYGGVVSVVGHASAGTGTADYVQHQMANQRISEARANAVAYQLLNYGVPPNAIRTAAVGDSHLLYSEAMPHGEAGNRRVEVYLSAY